LAAQPSKKRGRLRLENPRRRTCPDEKREIQRAIREQVNKDCALILTTGGTGVALRDVTPEAVAGDFRSRAAGFGEMMRMESMKSQKTPSSAQSSRGRG